MKTVNSTHFAKIRLRLTGIVLMTMLLVAGTGCSSKPSKGDVRSYVDRVTEKNGKAKVVRFEIINSIHGVYLGQKSCTVQFEYDVQYLRNVPASFFSRAFKKGEKVTCSDGMALFVKTDNGWLAEDGVIYKGYATFWKLLFGVIAVLVLLVCLKRYGKQAAIFIRGGYKLANRIEPDRIIQGAKRQLHAFATPANVDSEILTNASILELVECGLGEEVIQEKIRHSRCSFSLATSDIAALKRNKVPDVLVAAMIKAQSARGISAASTIDKATHSGTHPGGDEKAASTPSASFSESITPDPDPKTGRYVIS